MVVYCVKTNTPIEFRPAKKEDYLGSITRKHFIIPVEGQEVKLVEIGGQDRRWQHTDILTRGNESIIEEYHPQSAMRHWQIMRTVMPAGVWENW